MNLLASSAQERLEMNLLASSDYLDPFYTVLIHWLFGTIFWVITDLYYLKGFVFSVIHVHSVTLER